jgi:hypothetical protein
MCPSCGFAGCPSELGCHGVAPLQPLRLLLWGASNLDTVLHLEEFLPQLSDQCLNPLLKLVSFDLLSTIGIDRHMGAQFHDLLLTLYDRHWPVVGRVP